MPSVRLGALAAVAALAVGCGSARDISTTGSGQCTACHGYPPPPFVTGAVAHAASTDCHACHSGTVEADNLTLVPGGLHLDGIVQGAGHEPGYAAPSVHGPQAIAFLAGAPAASTCTDCHGADFSGGLGPSCNACHAAPDAGRPNFPGGVADWRANCTFCHGTPTEPYAPVANPVLAAPPQAVAGATDPTSPRVGAHQRHLQGGAYSDPFTCATCHSVPADLSHVSGATAVAPDAAGQRLFTPGSLGTYTPAGQTCAVYCHGSTITTPVPTPTWTAAGTLACTACHASPTSVHSTSPATATPKHATAPCSFCHDGYTALTTVNLALHVNGVENVLFQQQGAAPGVLYTYTAAGFTGCVECHNNNPNAPDF